MNNQINMLPAANLAPMKPLFDLKDGHKDTPVYITDGLKELLQDMLKRNADTYAEIANTTEITSNFIQGKQLWVPNYWNNSWNVQAVNRADPSRISAINIMQFYCTTQIKMITAINPDLEPVDEFKTKEYKKKVRLSKAVWNSHETKFYTPWFNQQEAVHAVVSGNYIESVQYDHMAKGVTVFKEIFGEKEVEISPGHSQCFTQGCNYQGTYSEFVGNGEFIPNCPKCGGHEITPPEPPQTQKYTSVIGMQPVQTGSLVLKLIPIQTFRYDISDRPENSSWSVQRISMSRRKLKYLLGGLDIPAQPVTQDRGIQSLNAMGKAGNTLGGIKNQYQGQNEDDIIVDRMCVMPEDVAHIINQKETETLSGQIIKKGQKLSELCPPEGMTVLSTNDGTTIIGVFLGVHHCEELSAGVYHMRFGSGLGRGSEDTVEVQKRFNRFDQQNIKYMDATSTPASTYVTGSVDRNHVKKIGHPGVVIPINQEVAQALGTSDLVKHLTPGQMPAQFFSYTYDILNQYRQLTSHTTDFSNAFPGVNNETATGARLAKSNSDSVWSPFQAVKGQVRVGTAQNTLKLYYKHYQGVSQNFSIGETQSRQVISKPIKGEDIDCDIEFAIVRDSEQPKTMYDRQTDLANMFMLIGNAGGIDQLKASDPKLLGAMYKAFDINPEDNTYDTMVDICEDRLEQGLSIAKQFQEFQRNAESQGMQVPVPPIEALLMNIQPPIIVEEPAHDIKAKWFMNFLDTPQGAEMDGETRQIVALFIKTHYEFANQQAQIVGQSQGAQAAAAQAPLIEQQQALIQQQAEADRLKREEEVQIKIAEATNNNNQKDLDRAQEKEVLEMGAENDKDQAVLVSSLKIVEQHNAPQKPEAKNPGSSSKKTASKK